MAALFFAIGAVIVTIIASLIVARVPSRSSVRYVAPAEAEVAPEDEAGDWDEVDWDDDSKTRDSDKDGAETDAAKADAADAVDAEAVTADDLARAEAEAQKLADAESKRAAGATGRE